MNNENISCCFVRLTKKSNSCFQAKKRTSQNNQKKCLCQRRKKCHCQQNLLNPDGLFKPKRCSVQEKKSWKKTVPISKWKGNPKTIAKKKFPPFKKLLFLWTRLSVIRSYDQENFKIKFLRMLRWIWHLSFQVCSNLQKHHLLFCEVKKKTSRVFK